MIQGRLKQLNSIICEAYDKPSFEAVQAVAKEVIGLFGIKDTTFRLASFEPLVKNKSWVEDATRFGDGRKASYLISENNPNNLDFKLYIVSNPSKRIIFNLMMLSPNYEDETYYQDKNIGIDFIVPKSLDRLIIVLSNKYKIRTLELYKQLGNTQHKIFSEFWLASFDFNNKAQTHKRLWDSFDIHELNKEFYKKISSFFVMSLNLR